MAIQHVVLIALFQASLQERFTCPPNYKSLERRARVQPARLAVDISIRRQRRMAGDEDGPIRPQGRAERVDLLCTAGWAIILDRLANLQDDNDVNHQCISRNISSDA